MTIMTMQKNNQSGLMAISSLLIISAVALAIAVSISLIGIGEAQNSLTYKKGAEVLKIAEGCAEEALLRLRDDVNYSGGSLQLGAGSCTISITDTGSDRTIDVTGTIAGPPQFMRSLQLTVKRTGQSIRVLTWQEI